MLANLTSLNSSSHMHLIGVQSTCTPSQELPSSIVLSCGIAESNHCHDTIINSTRKIVGDYFDAEIRKHELILEKLKAARSQILEK